MLIGAGVSALILFIWQFLSWGPVLNIHGAQMAYTPQQEAILETLNSANLEEGTYFMPRVPEDATAEEMEAMGETSAGKPWAIVKYRKSFNPGSAMNFIRGFAADFVATLLLCWVLLKFAKLDLTSSLLTSISIGVIGYLTISYLNSVWFDGSTLPELIDAIVSWGLVGAWLGWWLPRGE